jgi:sortase (surface protein transpeptidase)
VRVHLPGIGVTAPVRAVGVDARGDVAIPERVDSVGWYRYSAAPGTSAGSTVLVGHVDSAASGAGAFFRLRDLGRDDRVVLDLAGGRRLSYRVVSRAEFPKTSVPLPDLFSLAGPARLTLITCGGSFDAAVGSYRDNMVITAVPR